MYLKPNFLQKTCHHEKIIISMAMLFLVNFIFAQTPTQTIKGTVVDKDKQEPLIGATVWWMDF